MPADLLPVLAGVSAHDGLAAVRLSLFDFEHACVEAAGAALGLEGAMWEAVMGCSCLDTQLWVRVYNR